MAVQPRDEQEIILTYDREQDKWFYYGDVPHLNRKWRPYVTPTRETIEEGGTISMLDGEITGIVMIGKKRTSNMTEEQRKAASERMKKLKQSQINSTLQIETN